MGTQASPHQSLDLGARFSKVFGDKIYRKLVLMLGAHAALGLRTEGLSRFTERVKENPKILSEDVFLNCTASECFLQQLENLENEVLARDRHTLVRRLMELYIDVLCLPRNPRSL